MIRLLFSCGGCDATAEGTGPLRRNPSNTVEDVTPEGWVAFDPYTYCTYCPKCWAKIEGGDDDNAHPHRAA